MQRRTTTPRANWQDTIAHQGLLWHTDADPFWREGTYYEFTMPEIERIESATDTLYAMCLEAGQHLVAARTDDELALPPGSCERIKASFATEKDQSIYARFDLRFDADNSVKMYEINGDTPTMLVESSVAQWFWKEDCFPKLDQFNSIHERLVAAWARLRYAYGSDALWLTGVLELVEEAATLAYLGDTAIQAGMAVHLFDITDVGLTQDGEFVDDLNRALGLTFKLYPQHIFERVELERQTEFVDDLNRALGLTFKLYPLEDMLRESFGAQLGRGKTKWIEPLWKQALSHKGLLAALWEIYPGNELLLPASFDAADLKKPLPKPFFGREGAGMRLDAPHSPDVCYQEWAPLTEHDGFYPVIGSWVIDGHAAGMGIRETSTPITDTSAQFVPHVINVDAPSAAQQAQWLKEDTPFA